METATDFSQNIKKQLTNTLYVVSVDGHTNVLYMNAITGECNLVFDTRIAIDNVMIKYHNTIENDDMAILEFNYFGKHTEVLLRNGEKVSEDMDNVSMFYSITDISENLFSYDRGDEMNVIDRFGTNKKVSFDCLEDYLDEYGDMLEEEKETDTENDKLVSLLNCIKEKGMPKQVIICSENAVRAYSEIKKLEIKDKKLFIENCLCEFNNDEQVHFIY